MTSPWQCPSRTQPDNVPTNGHNQSHTKNVHATRTAPSWAKLGTHATSNNYACHEVLPAAGCTARTTTWQSKAFVTPGQEKRGQDGWACARDSTRVPGRARPGSSIIQAGRQHTSTTCCTLPSMVSSLAAVVPGMEGSKKTRSPSTPSVPSCRCSPCCHLILRQVARPTGIPVREPRCRAQAAEIGRLQVKAAAMQHCGLTPRLGVGATKKGNHRGTHSK